MKRRNYAKIAECFEMPNLVEIQTKSYFDFLQMDVNKSKRARQGLEEVFHEVFPIESHDKAFRLEYINHTLGKPKYTILECQKRAMTYAVSLKIKVRLCSSNNAKEQEVYLCDLPLMTDTGTFIINGDERVVVSQLHR